jgi:predicted membrane protein
MGVGAMRIDLRDVELPPGRTDLRAELGLGEIQVLVPNDLCVTSESTVEVGMVDVGGGAQGGVDLDVHDERTVAEGVPELHLVADVGIGAVQVGDQFIDFNGPPLWDGRWDNLRSGTNRLACRGEA